MVADDDLLGMITTSNHKNHHFLTNGDDHIFKVPQNGLAKPFRFGGEHLLSSPISIWSWRNTTYTWWDDPPWFQPVSVGWRALRFSSRLVVCKRSFGGLPVQERHRCCFIHPSWCSLRIMLCCNKPAGKIRSHKEKSLMHHRFRYEDILQNL